MEIKLLKQVYDTTFLKARNVQHLEQRGIQIDGRIIWGQIETSVKDIILLPEQPLMYNKENLERIYVIMKKFIAENKICDSEYQPKYNHFFMQLLNLVTKKSGPENSYLIQINRILQLAYNAGQLSVFIEEDKLPIAMQLFVEKYRLLDLDTYVTQDVQNRISDLYGDKLLIALGVLDKLVIEPSQRGGGKYSSYKYFKFKNINFNFN